LSLLPGQSQRVIEVRPLLDDQFEAPESLAITLRDGFGYRIATPNAQAIT